MTTLHQFVDASGNYLGAWDNPASAPQGAVEVPKAPADARQTWTGSAWSAPPAVAPAPVDARLWLERLPLTKQTAIVTAGIANPAIMRWLLLAAGAQAGVDVTNADTTSGVAALVTAGIITTADQAILLAP